MEIGDSAVLKLGQQIDDTTFHVLNIKSNEEGILKVKGRLKKYQEGCVKGWVIQYDKNKKQYIYGNSYFGKFSISSGISEKYTSIIKRIISEPESISDSDISVMKGMVNRCLKRDQWDWYTTYEYLGYPASKVLHQFVADSIIVRDDLRNGLRDSLLEYRTKYGFLFNNMLFHLGYVFDDVDYDIPVKGLNSLLWDKLSDESRKNLTMLERVDMKSSIYVLMHYFVTLEQEFFRHIIAPFVSINRADLNDSICAVQRYSQTHDILIGKAHNSLGAIPFLGRFAGTPQACSSSVAISAFTDYLGDDLNAFKDICKLIDRTKISGLSIITIRNGLAHGNSDVISQIDNRAYICLRSFLLEAPDSMIERIIAISKLS